MKVSRNPKFTLGLLALLTPVLLTSGCTYLNKVIAKDSLNQGVIDYNQGKIKMAQDKFRSATDRDPSSPVAWLYLGSTVVKDYKILADPERTKVANEALDIYKKALDLAGGNCKIADNAISYIATIYDDLSNMDEWRNWLLKRAEGACTDKDTKAVTYYSVGVRYWDCSYSQTTRYQDKTNKDAFAYRNMDYDAAKADKAKAEDCVNKGFEYIDKALAVDPEYPDAYFYKALLYREKQKLSKEEPKRKEYEAMANKLNEQGTTLQKKREAAAAQNAAAPKG
jgi:Tfp pilus assembly protein PilF